MPPRNDRRMGSGAVPRLVTLAASSDSGRNDPASGASAVIEHDPRTDSSDIAARIFAFARFVRASGLPIGISENVDAARVAEICGVTDRERLRWGLRSLFCKTRDDFERFDELFDRFWSTDEAKTKVAVIEGRGRGVRGAVTDRDAGGTAVNEATDGLAAGSGTTQSGASTREGIARQDFRHFTQEEELHALAALVERLAMRIRRRAMHRLEISKSGKRLDFRTTIRRSLPYGGVPLKPAFRLHKKRQPKLVLLLDVSGSMNLYSMLFLRFARAITRAFDRVEVFLFHTSLVRITEALAEHSIDRMKQSMEVISAGWAGGTRIGASIAELNERYAARVLSGQPIVIIVSDGLDTGPPAQLTQELRELRRRARRLVWLNPLLGRKGYAPTAKGMSAALPYLDAFLPAHNLASLEALEPYLVSL